MRQSRTEFSVSMSRAEEVPRARFAPPRARKAAMASPTGAGFGQVVAALFR